MRPPEALNCCSAHAPAPLIINRQILERIESNADVLNRQAEAVDARRRHSEAEKAATAATMSAMAGTTAKLAAEARAEAARGRLEAQKRETREAAEARCRLRRQAREEAARQVTLALRSRDAVKQLDAALKAALALDQRQAHVEARQRHKEAEEALEAEHRRQVLKRIGREREAQRQRQRETQRRKQELCSDLQKQIKEIDEKRKLDGREREELNREMQEDLKKQKEEQEQEKEKKGEKRCRLLEEGLGSIAEERKRRQELREREEKERLICLAYDDFKRETQEKLEKIHKEGILADKSERVREKVFAAQASREAKFEEWNSKIADDRKQRETRLLADVESRWSERRRRAVEYRDHQLEAAEQQRRRQKVAFQLENAFDWRLQQRITAEWKRLRQEERRRQQAANKIAYDQQLAEEKANRAFEAAVDTIEEEERSKRFQQEDREVLEHAQKALEKCKLDGRPVEPLERAVALFKKRRGLGPPPPPRASVRAHLDVGLDLDRVRANPDYYL
ncbi:trichohyalin-like [Neocloeon triangulifer]|uniref:trichohyalin-like n=1 Tax=Neocloeon triangulifer TaxID=2078957 RepID=UPI00286F039D|nr:trichohyalin-like [Neocloeon triangulifer]